MRGSEHQSRGERKAAETVGIPKLLAVLGGRPQDEFMSERRQRRSVRTKEALALFLEAERKRLGVRALTVGTEQGQLIAGAGIGLRRVAAVGASVDAQADTTPLSPSLATWRLRVNDQHVVVTCLGRKMTADLGEGVRRILSSTE